MFDFMKHILPVLLVFLLCFSAEANAFRVAPMVYDLEPAGKEASKTIRIFNTGGDKLPVEIFAEKRIIHEDGSETREPAEDDFLIFPPQAIIDPSATQAIRVQYMGDPTIEESVGYVITVAQLPVDLSKVERSGVTFAFRFGTSVNVVPQGAKPKISTSDATGQDGKLAITVKNDGNSYTRLTLGEWFLSNNQGKEYILKGDELKEAISQPLIQPNTTRNITLPLPDDWDSNDIQAGLQAVFKPYQ
jgi:fimbrial chaperone protein